MTPKQLKLLRLRIGSQVHTAKLLGVSERFLKYRESGEREIPRWLEYAILWLESEV